jgi:hypothetical protein
MSRVPISACITILVFLAAGIAHAEVVTIEGTIKSVDARKRTITVETGSKTLTLDVSSKAKVLLDGQEASLDSLKPGQKATLSYHDKLEVVLKITAATTATARNLQLDREHFELTGRYKANVDLIEFLKGADVRKQSNGKSKERFTPPIAVTYEATASPDACFDIFPGMLGQIRLLWGVDFNKKTRILLGKEKIEIPHRPIRPDEKNTIVMKVDKHRHLTITVNGEEQYSRIVDENIKLFGPVIIGGGIGHVTYTSVVLDQRD